MSSENINKWCFGRIKTYNDERGFGFVRDLSDRKEHFIHISNVQTPPISQNDEVIFKLKPSTKKPNSFEALDLIHLNQFNEDLAFLVQIFKEHSYPSSIRESVLKSLKGPQREFLFEELINTYVREKKRGWVNTVIEIIMNYSSGEYKSLNEEFFIKVIEETGNEQLMFEIWEKELLPIQISKATITKVFINSDKKRKITLLQRIKDQNIKVELFETLLSENKTEDVLNILGGYLVEVNKLFSRKIPPMDTVFWENKKEHELVVKCTTHIKENLSPKKLLRLSLKGLLDAFPKEYVFENFNDLGRTLIKSVFESEFLDSDEKFHLMKRLMVYNNLVLSKTYGENYREKALVDTDLDKITKSYTVLLKLAQKTLTESHFDKIDSLISDILPDNIEYDLWIKGLTLRTPTKAISSKLLEANYGLEELRNLISKSKIGKEEVIKIVKENLKDFGSIRSKSQFQCFNKHASILTELDQTPNEDLITTENHPFLKASEWLRKGTFTHTDYLKLVFLYFQPEDQVKYIRHLFQLEHTKGNGTISTSQLYELIDVHQATLKPILESGEVLIDYSVQVLIQAIQSLESNGRFLFESELLKLFYTSISNNKGGNFKAEHFFDKCEGRYEAEYKWNTNGTIEKVNFGESSFYYAITFSVGEQKTTINRGGYSNTNFEKNPNFDLLKGAVKKLPGSKWNPKKQHWGVPSKYKAEVDQFAKEYRFFIDIERSNYKNNTHLVEFKRKGVPNGVTYCEGRLANEVDINFGKEFWWCNNKPCFDNCKETHTPAEWKDYTMLEMLKIKGFNLDHTNRAGDIIEDGKYYQFISSINRFNLLLDRLYCKECEEVLYAVDDSHFAFYRVTHFHCTNQNCGKYQQDVYLHHCLNGKCNGIIDSRISEKCPNGLFICSNESCGSCCSTKMFKRRLENLKKTGGYIHQDLEQSVTNNLGHLERKEYYCYHCGGQMENIGFDTYHCESCNKTYSIGKDNYNRKSKSSNVDNLDDDLSF